MYDSSLIRGAVAAPSDPTMSEPGFELQANAAGFYELKIWGKFPPRWLANLTSALSSRNIGIHRGAAHKVTPSLWLGTLEISPAAAGELPDRLDYLALTRDGAELPETADRVRLESFSLERRDGALFVEVNGSDSVGFLVTLLKTFAFFSLFPSEVRIDTPGGRVHDRFWLKGVAGIAPSDASMQGLRIELEKLLRT